MNDNQPYEEGNENNPSTLPPSGEGPENVPSHQETDEGEQQPGKKSAEARINELHAMNQELKGELDLMKQRMMAPPPPPAQQTYDPSADSPEVQKAISYLKQTGKFVDAYDLQNTVQGIQDRMALDGAHQRLEAQLNGIDGRPKYDRTEIEGFMRKRGVYDPEAAYKLMHEDELLDWRIKLAETERKKKPFVQRPFSSGGSRDDQTISREMIDEWLNGGPAGRAKYEQNRSKILALMAEGKL